MSILGRVADLFQSKTHRLIDALEDPNEALDLSYEKMLTGLQETRRHLAEVVAQQKSLERQIAASDRELGGAESDARLAVQAGRDDLARAALAHRQRVLDTRATLQQALDAIRPQVEKLADYQQRLDDRIQRFRTQKDTMKAGYAAAQAQMKVTQSLTGVGDRLGGVDETLRRAETKMLGARDKADALESMVEQGLIGDPLDRRSRAEKEISALRDAHAVDGDLAQLKREMGLLSLPHDELAALPPPADKD
jgi:phage shock protein A